MTLNLLFATQLCDLEPSLATQLCDLEPTLGLLRPPLYLLLFE